MECSKKCLKNNEGSGRTSNFIKVMYRLSNKGLILYAGLLVLVPSVICKDWPGRLTYESIYNSTNYAQLQHISKPYNIPVTYNSYSHSFNQDAKGNDVEDDFNNEEDNKSQLLVGFARDPFRYSVPVEDFNKGIRSINPQIIKSENRGKRGVLHLYNMLQCANGCDPLSYKGYGCYCGFLGSGRPTDGIDRCCQLHDKCYENIYCPVYTVYFQPYYWKCYHGEPLCALENYHTQNQVVNGCAGRLCQCDRQFAMCVKRYSCPKGRAFCRSSPLRLLQNILMFR